MLTHDVSLGDDAATSTGTSVAANASANTLGSWVQLGSDTTRDGFLFGVAMTTIAQGIGHLVDIGIDPAGGTTFTPVAQQIAVAVANSATAPALQMHFVPLGGIFVPSGSAVAARTRASTGSSALDVRAMLMIGAPDAGYNWVESLGISTADSGGTSIDPGATANTKGSWTTLAAATAYDIDAFVVMVNTDPATATQSDAEGFIDIAIEVSATQYVILGNYPFMQSGSEVSAAPRVIVPTQIAKGSKVVARAQSTLNTAGRRVFDLSLVGFNKHPLRAN